MEDEQWSLREDAVWKGWCESKGMMPATENNAHTLENKESLHEHNAMESFF